MTQEAAGATQNTHCVYAIDGDRSTREFLRKALSRHGWVVETFPSAEHFLSHKEINPRCCIVVDVELPRMNGIDLLNNLPPSLKRMPAIVLTRLSDVDTAVRAMKAGATDLLEKPVSGNHLRKAVSHAVLVALRERTNTFDSAAENLFSSLTLRQVEVLRLIVSGFANKVIAMKLGISQRTVEAHRAAIMRRLGVNSLPELMQVTLAGPLDRQSPR